MKKSKFMKHCAFVFLFFFPVMAFAQIVKTDEIFTDVYTFDGKVAFLKEIQVGDIPRDKSYLDLKRWFRQNYSGDPFNSSIDFSRKKYSAHAVSRIELLLPENSEGISRKVIMKYTFNAFLMNGLCVVEVSNISYLNNPKVNKNTLPDKVKAEDMISDSALSVADANNEIRQNTRKSTLFFLNELSLSLEKALNN
ncbi:DUF4468 domain-containing protein [Viscerimonas tarda]